MDRYVQPVPAPGDPYRTDWLLDAWLRRHLSAAELAAADTRLTALAADVNGPLRAAHTDAEAHPPHLVRYGPWGERVDRIRTADGWRRLRDAAARHALVALPYQAPTRATWGAATRIVQHALLHLYAPESATFSCPVAMADGAAALLSRPDVDAAVRDSWLPRLTSTDPATAVTSGQWMTEARGGSDLSGSTTTADPAGDGSWRLTGEKWFCSAIDAPVAVALARPAGAGPGSRHLAPFLVPRYAADSPLADADADPDAPAPGIRVHRLKDKLGTRALPTAEVGLRQAYALPLGDPARPGLSRAMTLVVVTRLHNASAAAGGMRRGLAYAHAYATARDVAGGRLVDSPAHRAVLGTLAVDAAGAFVLAGDAFALLGRVEVGGDPASAALLRLVAPMAKLATGRLAVAAASEYVECFGGAGYVEDTGVPRLLRDAQVLPIWEGTTTVLALDVLRAVVREDAAPPLLARLDRAADAARGFAPSVADTLAETVGELRSAVAAVTVDPGGPATLAAVRPLALRMAYALAGALLVEQAVAGGQEAAEVAARLWARRWLRRDDVSVDAHQHLELLSRP
ncbi:acyl-CoA dehydrogenase family protein [Solwaraspora sp. WMMD406]|uniref:acyl-CoA dehydrogenase family protein n=1 Tax=Solwaraspora sp. WMMD406 TaxID=3016095 RepID=UPI0024170DE2|nr:acyl-CoA dehydrogenase family protein [Solwaraspora sp. WMMD406]MDG4766182.1 acyl-CoA dehydrogenase family protein [Solwaraspora sp. WMMD406]